MPDDNINIPETEIENTEGTTAQTETAPQNEIEDIVSMSPQAKKAEKKTLKGSDKGISKGLAVTIKAISFLVALIVFALFLVVAYLLYTKDPLFAAVSLAIIIAGAIFSTIVMFLIYAIGQILSQNNEILKKINERDR